MIVLGIDPGTATTGYGVIEASRGRLVHVAHGVIRTPASDPSPRRLAAIHEAVTALIAQHRPDAMATEQLFFGSNVSTALIVGRTVGVALLAAAQAGLPWTEYRPASVKMAVAGYGAAEKKQVQAMVQRLLALPEPPHPDDAADALAVAICHAHSVGPG